MIGGKLRGGKSPMPGICGAKSFLLAMAWTLKMLENERTMNRYKNAKRADKEAIWVWFLEDNMREKWREN